ncbi:polymorphic toxin type 50 domain-containing protein [Lactococcus raffinolactis]|nr:polymorphic toxin type 50 domain-containing protein [Lactococcus raffinolactis]MDG4961501.1 polymorphic toxin type 50 domain-containing protein [Lactococcus raffinolactis]
MSDYWQKRAIKAEKKVNDGAKQLEDVVARAYRQAQDYITKQVAKLFARTKQQTGLDEDEAKRMLNQTVPVAELVELRRLAKDISNPDLQNQAKKRLTGLALKHRITVAEDLKAKSYLVSKQVADVQLKRQTSFYIDTIDESYKEATAESIIRDAQPSVKKGHEFKQLSTKSVENILDSHWKGSNYSKRLWGDTEALAKRLEELFTVEALTGMSEFKMARAIASEFDRSINVSRRLIRTEANYMANQGKLKAWQTRGIERYQIIAILDLRTSEICQHQDHKVYLVEDAEVGVTMPPFHPWCRSIIAYYSERLANTPRKAIDPITGKTVDIKGDATYNDWMDKLKDLHSDDEIEKMRQKTVNIKMDTNDLSRMKSVLGASSPQTLEQYQELKYNRGSEWIKLKDNYFVKSRLKDGRFGSIINPEKQSPHMKSTATKGKSYFEDNVDVQRLFDKFAGTGKIERTESGRITNKERVDTGEIVGVDISSGKRVTGIKIHHSKQRTHIVPWDSTNGNHDL